MTEIIGFDILVNRLNHAFGSDREDYAVTMASIRRNLRSSWGTDNDPFAVNQLGHPYQGSMYYGFARSAGFNFWESAGYTFAGSAFWEIFGETTRPSRNDQVASGIGGTFLGEALFRMSNLLLEQGGGMSRPWREAVAALVSPSTGFNRLVFADRFGGIFSSRDASYYSRASLGYVRSLREEVGITSTRFDPNEAQVDFSIDYGLPGKKGYEYTRPFDYFNFQATASSANGFENVLTRGLLVGKSYEAGPDYRGVWGIYGNYDYISPQTFQISTTGLSLGTTGHWWLTRDLSLEGTGMLGLGYSAVGTAHSASSDRDYNYGVTPQALLALRLTYTDRASLDLDRARVLRQQGRIGNLGRPRQHRPPRRRADGAHLPPARGLDPLPRQPPRRELRRLADRQAGAQHHRPLLHAARPGSLRRRRLALTRACPVPARLRRRACRWRGAGADRSAAPGSRRA